MSGYSEGGSSLSKKSLKTWTPQHLSAKSDIDRNLSTLRNRAHDLAINSAIGAAAINTFVTGVIGSGLKIFPRINAAEMGISAEEARRWRRQVKQEFEIWAQDCDYLRRNNYYEQQSIAFESSLVDGDSFVLMKRRQPTAFNPYSLCLQVVESARVSTPNVGTMAESIAPNGNRIVNGVEVDENGRQIAIHISNRLWNEVDVLNSRLEWQRVEIFGKESGMRNVLMICRDVRPEQFRGVPLLAPVIESLKQLARYADAELTSSIIKSFFSVFFTQPASNFTLNEIAGVEEDELDISEYKLGSGTLNALPRGVDVKAIDAQNAQNVFDSFMTHYIKQIGAALNIPYEVLMKNFQSSYSASRAALLQAESEFRRRKQAFITDFCQPIYEQFLTEAIALGRIKAPHFFDDVRARYLWSRADFYKQENRILDPQREAAAMKTRLSMGITTYSEEIGQATGNDFEDVMATLQQEMELLKVLEGKA